ncbi:hypothetical protein WJ968_26480 [Achromobacter xylosoxidans]
MAGGQAGGIDVGVQHGAVQRPGGRGPGFHDGDFQRRQRGAQARIVRRPDAQDRRRRQRMQPGQASRLVPGTGSQVMTGLGQYAGAGLHDLRRRPRIQAGAIRATGRGKAGMGGFWKKTGVTITQTLLGAA